MHIDSPPAEQIQKLRPENPSVCEYHKKISFQGRSFFPGLRTKPGGLKDRDSIFCSSSLHRRRSYLPSPAADLVRRCQYTGDFDIPGFGQGPERRNCYPGSTCKKNSHSASGYTSGVRSNFPRIFFFFLSLIWSRKRTPFR